MNKLLFFLTSPLLKQREDILQAAHNEETLINYIIDNKLEYQNTDISLEDHLHFFIKNVKEVLNHIRTQIKSTNTSFTNTRLFNRDYYEKFDAILKKLFDEEYESWLTTVQRALDTGEIREDIVVLQTVQHFRCLYFGFSMEWILGSKIDINELERLFFSYYNEIKCK